MGFLYLDILNVVNPHFPDATPYERKSYLILSGVAFIFYALILNFKGHFKDLGVIHIIFYIQNLYKLLKRKYEPNKYMLFSKTKI